MTQPGGAVRRRFFVGVGTQRSGTSWIADYLAGHPEVAFSPIKEIHFFDSLYSPVARNAIYRPARLRGHARQLWRRPEPTAVKLRWTRRWLGVLARSEASYRSFLESAGDAPLAGEFTPAYATVSEDGFRAMERLLDRPRYLVIFRNPADRFRSQMRHHRRRGDREPDDVALLLDAPDYHARCDYVGALERMRRVIEPERILTIFYEHLFDPARHEAECARLCGFLGVAPRPGRMDRRVNADRDEGGDDWGRATVVARLRPQYERFLKIYGGDLPASWRADLAASAAA